MLYAVGDGYPAPHRQLTEPLRKLYVTAYTLPSTSAYLHRNTAKRLEGIFWDISSGRGGQGLYEMEIASTGMMRWFVAVPCDMYFTVGARSRALECALKLCNVPPERRRGRRTIGRLDDV